MHKHQFQSTVTIGQSFRSCFIRASIYSGFWRSATHCTLTPKYTTPTVRSNILVWLQNFVIFEVFGVKFSAKKSGFQNCLSSFSNTLHEYLIEYQKENPRTLFLTGWQIRTSIIFYIISLFSHIFKNKQLNKLRDTLWLSILFPLGIEVCIVFWAIWAIDRELVLSSENDKYFPAHINHLWHTLPFFLRIVESLSITVRSKISAIVKISMFWPKIILKISKNNQIEVVGPTFFNAL